MKKHETLSTNPTLHIYINRIHYKLELKAKNKNHESIS